MSAVVHLPESSAAPWPTVDAYRPPGWTSPLSPSAVVATLAALKKADERDFDPVGAAERKERIVDLERHVALLRQAWCTRLEVWRLAEALLGPPEVDPFWNPWSVTHATWSGVRLLDGNDGRDGFDLSLWGRVSMPSVFGPPSLIRTPPFGRGRTAYVNGPHGDTSRYVALSTGAAAAGHRVAAVTGLDGCGWFAGGTETVNGDPPGKVSRDVLSCDVLAIPADGRMSFVVPPVGLGSSSPRSGYGLALWGVPPEVLFKLWPDGGPVGPDGRAVRVTHAGAPWVLLRGCGDPGVATTVRDLTSIIGNNT